MKIKLYRLLIIYFLIIGYSGNGFAQPPQHRKLSVLFIGNSYTYVNNLPLIIQNLAAANGDTVLYAESTIGGYSLPNHFADAQTMALVNQQPWDYVILQDLNPFIVNDTETSSPPGSLQASSKFLREMLNGKRLDALANCRRGEWRPLQFRHRPPCRRVTLSVSDELKGNSCKIAARPAMDSVMPRIRGASCNPVKSHCPIRRGLWSATVIFCDRA